MKNLSERQSYQGRDFWLVFRCCLAEILQAGVWLSHSRDFRLVFGCHIVEISGCVSMLSSRDFAGWCLAALHSRDFRLVFGCHIAEILGWCLAVV